MSFKFRKLLIFLASLAVVLSVYLLYIRVTETGRVEIGSADEPPDAVVDTNTAAGDDEIAMVDNGVGVGTVRKAVYKDYEDGRLIAEFGFEELIHEERNEWEIQEPYRNLYYPEVACYIKADQGRVTIEKVGGDVAPKDATLTGNVEVHIVPRAGADILESFIYLDDIWLHSKQNGFTVGMATISINLAVITN